MKRAFLGIAFLVTVAACGAGASSTAAGGGSVSVGPARTTLQQATSGSASTAANPADAATVAPLPPVTGDGPKVIRSGRVTVEIPNGQFDSKLTSLEDVIAGYGGYQSGSDAEAEGGALRSGTVTFQVPAEHFQDALDAARKLGKVQGYVVSSQDVSNQYVALNARLANEEAVRDAILQFFKDAHSVQDDVTIENQLGQVTAQIEQLKGQIDYLDHATAYSTIAVTLREAAAAAASGAGDSFGFAKALNRAAHNFVYVVDGMLEVAGSLLPFLLLLVPIWFVLRYRRGLARLLPL